MPRRPLVARLLLGAALALAGLTAPPVAAGAYAAAAAATPVVGEPGCGPDADQLGRLIQQRTALQHQRDTAEQRDDQLSARDEQLDGQLRQLRDEVADLARRSAPLRAAIDAHNREAQAHNARAAWLDRSDPVAVAEYNAESERLNARARALDAQYAPYLRQAGQLKARASALERSAGALERQRQQTRTELQATTSQLTALDAELQRRAATARSCALRSAFAPLQRPAGAPPRFREALQRATDALPRRDGQIADPPQGPWTQDSPWGRYYAVLRGWAQHATGSDVVLQGAPKPQVGSPDPSRPNTKIQPTRNGEPRVSKDHVVPLYDIVRMPGFVRLPVDDQYLVINAPFNLQWLSSPSNSAKNNRSAAAVARFDSTWAKNQVTLEQRCRTRLQQLIDDLLQAERARNGA